MPSKAGFNFCLAVTVALMAVILLPLLVVVLGSCVNASLLGLSTDLWSGSRHDIFDFSAFSYIFENYGEKKLYEGGLSVRTTLDPKMQLMARKALVDGLVRYDEAHGWHGTIKTIDLGQDWGVPLGDIPEYGDIKPWRLAVVLDASDSGLRIGLQPERD